MEVALRSEYEPSWGVRINASEWPRRTDTPQWANRAHRDKWGKPGLILWDRTAEQITHLSGTSALRLLEHLRIESEWRKTGIVVGTPAHGIDLKDTNAEAQMILDDEIILDPAQCAQLLEVIWDNQSVLQKMREQEQAECRRVTVEIARILLEATVLTGEQADCVGGCPGTI